MCSNKTSLKSPISELKMIHCEGMYKAESSLSYALNDIGVKKEQHDSDYSGKKFIHSSALASYKRFRDGENPLKCAQEPDMCSNRTSSSSPLRKLKIVHCEGMYNDESSLSGALNNIVVKKEQHDNDFSDEKFISSNRTSSSSPEIEIIHSAESSPSYTINKIGVKKEPDDSDFSDEKFSSSSDSASHKRYHDGEKLLKCVQEPDMCSNRTSSSSPLSKLKIIHCEGMYNAENSLSGALNNIVVKKEQHDIDFSGEKFPSSYDLASHKGFHDGENPLKCAQEPDMCSNGISSSSSLSKLKITHCEGMYNVKSSLPDALNNTGVKKEQHDTDYSGKKFFISGNRTSSSSPETEIINSAESSSSYTINNIGVKKEPDDSDFSDEKFPSSSDSASHKIFHKEENLLKCDICAKVFCSKSCVKSHKIRQHIAQRPYQYVACEFCGKAFPFTHELDIHKIMHTGEKFGKRFNKRKLLRADGNPYNCEHCGKSFLLSPTLVKNQSLHTGKKSYVCERCGKTFLLENALRRHMEIHTTNIPSAQDTINVPSAQDTIKVPSAQDTIKISNGQDTIKVISAQDEINVPRASVVKELEQSSVVVQQSNPLVAVNNPIYVVPPSYTFVCNPVILQVLPPPPTVGFEQVQKVRPIRASKKSKPKKTK